MGSIAGACRCGAVAALLLVTIAGCGPRVGTVAGKVTYKGKPLHVGNVTFFGEDNRVVFTPIDEDGAYRTETAPVGNVKVTVETPMVRQYVPTPGVPPPPPGMLSPAYKHPNVPIPPRYARPDTSGLTTTVKAGEQTYDIELIP